MPILLYLLSPAKTLQEGYANVLLYGVSIKVTHEHFTVVFGIMHCNDITTFFLSYIMWNENDQPVWVSLSP